MTRNLRSIRLVALPAVAMALAAPLVAPAREAPQAETFPTATETPALTAAGALFAALEGNEPLEPFVRGAFSEASLAQTPPAVRARELERLRELSGGFESADLHPQGERMVEAFTVSRKGARHARVVLFTSRNEPGRIADLFVLPRRDPARAAADAFPAGPVAHEAIPGLIRRRIDALTEEGLFSGAILVARGDDVILREARGLADRAWEIPNRPETRFQVASLGKMWTAVIALKLAEEGALSLDDHLARWVPEYPHPATAQQITLRQLLHHRAAIGPWDGRAIDRAMTSRELAATMTADPGEPGRAFSYSNAGYVLLAAAAERATGLTYPELVERYVFTPAGMTASGLWPVSAVVPDRARGYLQPADDPLGFGPRLANEQFLGFGGDGSGGGYSTVDDLLAFHRALAGGRLISPPSFASMLNDAVDFAGSPRPRRYGLGLRLEDCAGTPTLGHDGGGAGSGVSDATFASLDGSWTVIVLGNVDPGPEELAFEVCELVHRAGD